MPKFKVTLSNGASYAVEASSEAEAKQKATAFAAQEAAPRRPATRPRPPAATRSAPLVRGQQGSFTQEVGGALATFNRGIPLFDEIAGAGLAIDELVNGRASDPVDAFQRGMARQRGIEDNFRARRPLAATGLQSTATAGSSLIPLGTAVNTAATGGRLAAAGRGAVTAGAQGAIYGATDRGTVSERLNSGLVNLALGAGTGAAFGAALGGAARPAAPGRRPSPPQRRTPAERQVGDAIERATTRAGLTRADVAAQINAGNPPWMIAGADDLAEIAAQHPGPARRMIRDNTRDAVADAGNDVRGTVANTLGGRNDYFATADSMLKAKLASAEEGMSRFGGQQFALSDDSVLALRSDLARNAIRARATNALASTDPAERQVGAQLNRMADDLLDRPGQVLVDVRSAQDISYALRQAASRAYSGASPDADTGKALKGIANSLRGDARSAVPEYDRWLVEYGDASDNELALQMGRESLSGNRMAEQIRRDLAEMGPAAMEHYRKGVGEAILAQIRTTKGDVGAMRSLLRGEEFRDRVAMAFPEGGFDDFMAQAANLVDRQNAANRIMQGSPTAFRQAGQADLQAQGPDALGYLLDAGTLDPGALARRGIRDVMQAVPKEDRTILGSTPLNALLGEALTDPATMMRLIQEAGSNPQAAEALQQAATANPQFAAAIASAQQRLIGGMGAASASATSQRPGPPR